MARGWGIEGRDFSKRIVYSTKESTLIDSTNIPRTLFQKLFKKPPVTGKISILTVIFVQINVKEFDIYKFSCLE